MSNRRRGSRPGFTLLEATIVSGLMAVLAVLLAAVWAGFGQPARDIVERARVSQEAQLAIAALARDLGGSLANAAARLGTQEQGAWVGWLHPGGTQLWLCFDGGNNPNGEADWSSPDTVITYLLEEDRLVRWDQTANTTFTVARYLDRLEVRSAGSNLQIVLTFVYRNLSRTYTLEASSP
jgi:type II secretory pathway component PulJ